MTKLCAYPKCFKHARPGYYCCVSHGGGPQCSVNGCNTYSISLVSEIALCKKHGGGYRCQHSGCTKSAARPSDKCNKHSECNKGAARPSNKCSKHNKSVHNSKVSLHLESKVRQLEKEFCAKQSTKMDRHLHMEICNLKDQLKAKRIAERKSNRNARIDEQFEIERTKRADQENKTTRRIQRAQDKGMVIHQFRRLRRADGTQPLRFSYPNRTETSYGF